MVDCPEGLTWDSVGCSRNPALLDLPGGSLEDKREIGGRPALARRRAGKEARKEAHLTTRNYTEMLKT